MTQQDETDLEVQEIEPASPPVDQEIEQAEELRSAIAARIEAQAADGSAGGYVAFVSDYFAETGADEDAVLAALVSLAQSTLAKPAPPARRERPAREKRDRFDKEKSDPLALADEEGMERYRIEVGYSHGVKPGSIVGAIANEADISSEYIGRIEIYDDFSTVDLPEGMPDEVCELLQDTRVRGQALLISKVGG